MSSDESLEDRQRNELEALQAIYEDLKDLRTKSAWNKWTPLNLSITLTPQQGSSGTQEFYVKVDLHIICNHIYPNSVPNISLENPKGISNILLSELQERLDKKANQLKGEEMIFLLCQDVQEFLHKHNRPAPKSFYDQMLDQQKEREKKEKLAKEMEQNRLRQHYMETQKRLIEMQKSEVRIKKENRRISENEEDCDSNRRKSKGSTVDEGFLCQHKKTELIKFSTRSVQRGSCMKHSPDHCRFQGIDMESGQVLYISAWIFQNIKDIQQVRKQINSIEQELNYLTTLKHPNLTHYFGIKYEVFKNSVTVYLLEEFVCGSNFSSLFSSRDSKSEVNFLKHIARGVLTALDYLHRNNVVHKDIKDTSVYLSDNGVVKVAHYSIYRRLSDLNPQSHKNYGKKTDIFKFGLLLLSVLKGCPVSDKDLDPPSGISTKLQDFLSRCLEKDESHRHSAAQLLGHSLFQDSDQSPKAENKELDFLHDSNIYDELILTNDMSRINKDFEVIERIGSGAFGSVIKVRNKLDGRDYAIKRIKLNQKNAVLTKKIIREVKLLSRLNHENVVRYYNSWIEKTTIKKDNNTGGESLVEKVVPGPEKKDKLNLDEHLEAFVPSVKSVEFSVTYDSVSQGRFLPPDDESSDEDEIFESGFRLEDSDSDSIIFERDSDSSDSENEKSLEESSDSSTSSESETTEPAINAESKEIVKQFDFMFIQMEFCEKSTLQTAIADNLYLDKDRYERLFREIVEGLSHIHLQGMIHRDLKPANIFLDSKDHVKIGDFGLATTSIISKPTENTSSSNSPEKVEKQDTVDESKTGLVGTALYAAPEISSKTKTYNEKVDIYSLGIILFEMCYRSINTGMERIEILKALRSKEIIFPEDASTILSEKKIDFIRWLLTHDTSKRPTCKEIFRSEYMPPAVLDDLKFRDLVTYTLSNPESTNYGPLISSCFNQPKSNKDFLYDKDYSSQKLQLREFVRKICVKIFEQHGGQNLITPLLIPRNKFYEHLDNCVKLMDHHGCIVCLSYDLRVPFAQYVVWNEITTLRRYSIDRVFQERKNSVANPKEQFHCAFDIVAATSDSLMPDAEILYIVSEILNYVFGTEQYHFVIRLNHTKLLFAIFQHCGIKVGHNEVYKKLCDYQGGKTSEFDLEDFFISLNLPDNMIALLLSLVKSEIKVSESLAHFKKITRNRTEAGKLAKEILQDLNLISYNARAFGVKLDIVVSPGLIHKVNGYSGMIFQFIYKTSKPRKLRGKKHIVEVVAAGGRYDSMIASFRSTKDVKQCAVGVSISLDKLVEALQKQPSEELPRTNSIDIAVCSIGEKQMKEEKVNVLRNLWKANLRCTLIEGSNFTEIENQATDLKVNQIVILKDNEPGIATVKSLDKERSQENKFSIKQLAENLQLIIQNSKEGGKENIPPSLLARSDSKAICTEHNCHLEVSIVMTSDRDKSSNTTRKRYETQINTVLDGVLQKLNGLVVALGLFIDMNVIIMLSSHLEFQTETTFHKSVEYVLEKNSKHKKYLNKICDVIQAYKIKRRSENITIVLFHLLENTYRVIV